MKKIRLILITMIFVFVVGCGSSKAENTATERNEGTTKQETQDRSDADKSRNSASDQTKDTSAPVSEPQGISKDSLVTFERCERLDEWDELLRYDQAVQVGDVLLRNNITVGELFERLQNSKYSNVFHYEYNKDELVPSRSFNQAIEVSVPYLYKVNENGVHEFVGVYTGNDVPEGYLITDRPLLTVYYLSETSDSNFCRLMNCTVSFVDTENGAEEESRYVTEPLMRYFGGNYSISDIYNMTFEEVGKLCENCTRSGYQFNQNGFSYTLRRGIALNTLEDAFNTTAYEHYQFEIDSKTGKVCDFQSGPWLRDRSALIPAGKRIIKIQPVGKIDFTSLPEEGSIKLGLLKWAQFVLECNGRIYLGVEDYKDWSYWAYDEMAVLEDGNLTICDPYGDLFTCLDSGKVNKNEAFDEISKKNNGAECKLLWSNIEELFVPATDAGTRVKPSFNVADFKYGSVNGKNMCTGFSEEGLKKLSEYNRRNLVSVELPAADTSGAKVMGVDLGGSSEADFGYVLSHGKTYFELVFADSYETVSGYAQKRWRLFSVIMNDSLEEIGASAFDGCTSLRKVVMGKNIKTIGNSAFWQCSALTLDSLDIGGKNISFNAFTDVTIDNLVISKAPASLENYYTEYPFSGCIIKHIEFGKELEAIPDNMFKNVVNLPEKIEIPGTFKLIGEGAFYGCRSLEELIIKAGVKEIGRNAFCECRSLKKVTIENGLSKIGDGAFYACYELGDIALPKSVTELGQDWK